MLSFSSIISFVQLLSFLVQIFGPCPLVHIWSVIYMNQFLIPFLSNCFEFLLFVAIICAVYILCMLATSFLHNTFKNSMFFTLFFDKNKFPLYKEGDKNFHTLGASFCSKQNNNNSNKYYHHSHNRIFCRWPERGKTFSHRKNDFIWESRTIFCYVEKNKYFSHLHYNFFPLFPPTICCYSWSLNWSHCQAQWVWH